MVVGSWRWSSSGFVNPSSHSTLDPSFSCPAWDKSSSLTGPLPTTVSLREGCFSFKMANAVKILSTFLYFSNRPTKRILGDAGGDHEYRARSSESTPLGIILIFLAEPGKAAPIIPASNADTQIIQSTRSITLLKTGRDASKNSFPRLELNFP